MAGRFPTLAPEEIQLIADNINNENTTKSMNQWLRAYRCWEEVRNENAEMHEIDPEDLDNVLKRFFSEIRKQNGQEYEPDSLRVMQAALHRNLVAKMYPANILVDLPFKGSRDVLEGKARELRAK